MILELPEEILLLIMKKLDLHSKICLYNVCLYLRNFITSYSSIKTIDVSNSTLATVDILKESFFKDVSTQIEDLSLRTVPNLTKSILIPLVKRIKNLKYLNISFTSIVIPDLIEIIKVTPSLRGISANFEFGNVNPCRLSPKMLNECRNQFIQLTDVEFVGSPSNLLYSELPYYVLEKAFLDSLKFTIIKCQHATYQSIDVVTYFKFKQMSFFISHWKEVNIYYGKLSEIPQLVMTLHSGLYEFVLIKWVKFITCKVYTSAALKGFFYQNFKIKEDCINKFDQEEISGNVAIFIWHREYNTFDNEFLRKLFQKLKGFFPQFIQGRQTFNLALLERKWFYVTPTYDAISIANDLLHKRKRIAPPTLILDYDHCFNEIDEIELTLNLEAPCYAISLSSSSNYLKKLTYLSLVGPFVKYYSGDFFPVLFNSCDKLCTLNLEAKTMGPLPTQLSKYILLSKSLRNLRLVYKRIDHKSMFFNLSQYKLLENIHIVDEGTEVVNIGDISCIIAHSPNMYSLFIQVAMSNSSKLKALRLLKKAKSLHNRSFLNIELHTGCGYEGLSYDPLMEVFKINPIKPV